MGRLNEKQCKKPENCFSAIAIINFIIVGEHERCNRFDIRKK